MPETEFPDWMDKTGFGVVGELTLEDGKRLTAEVVGFNEESNELIVRLISSALPHTDADPQDLAIPCSRILAFEPQSRATHPWPTSDPCRGSPSSFARFLLMTTIFLSMTAGSLALFILFLNKEPFRLQELSAISYTLFELFFTFAAHGKYPRYLFTCPAVRPQLPRLLLRHLGFLLALFALQTAALAAHPHLSDWWNIEDRKGITPFEGTLLLLCIGLAYGQAVTNRSLLGRAHREYTPELLR